MELEKQKLLVSVLAGNRDLMALCSGIVKPSYFDPSLKKSVRFLKEYFEKYKDVPRAPVVRAETGIILDDVGEINKAEMKFVSEEIETFCRNRAMTEAILSGPELIQKGDFGQVLTVLKDAISVGLVKDLGMDYFLNPEERLKNTLVTQARISTGWAELDELTGGGLGRQELIMFAANSGGGKSMTMLNLGKNLLAQGLNGVYISLEMSESVVSKRLDSMISMIGQDNLLKEMQKVASLIERAGGKMGKFIIKRMPENRTNINTIRSYLLQLEQATGFRPDFIIVDYIDIMGTTMSISMDNLFVKDKYVTEEVRSLGYDFDAIMISASQLGRGAIDAEKLSQAHIQGGISKINTSDYTIGIKQDDLMRASGEIYFEGLKTRNSAGTGVRKLLGWDPISLNITSLQKKEGQLQLNRKAKPAVLNANSPLFERGDAPKKDDGILGLMNT
jgi:KaiC/GvpD/RAD55 family RecA-like ATPase